MTLLVLRKAIDAMRHRTRPVSSFAHRGTPFNPSQSLRSDNHYPQALRMETRRRLALAALAACVLAPHPAFSQQAGSLCSDLNRTIFPWYLGRADNNAYICNGSTFQTLLTTTASPLSICIEGGTTP